MGSYLGSVANSVPLLTRPSISWANARIRLSRFFVVSAGISLLICRGRWIQPGSTAAELLLVLGMTLATIAMAGRIWCSIFIAGRKNSTLVTDGPYTLTRNPLYFFSLVGAVGVALVGGILTVALLLVAAFALYYPAVIRREEALLQARHGQAFIDYCASIPVFWPRWSGTAGPDRWLCHPRIFLLHLGSALWFPIACALVHSAVASGLPVWMVLP